MGTRAAGGQGRPAQVDHSAQRVTVARRLIRCRAASVPSASWIEE